MQSQDYPAAASAFNVRPEITDSVLRLLDQQAEFFSGPGESLGSQALGAMFAGIAESVRAGNSIYYELSMEPSGSPMSREITTAIGHSIFMCGLTEDGDGVRDWRYVADLAALAADIEAALSPTD